MKFVELEILNFGKLENNEYFNPLINWYLNIKDDFEAKLISKDERIEFYNKSTSGILMNPVEEINEILIWTDLIELKKKDSKLFFKSSIRRINKNENKVIQEYLEKQLLSLKESSFIDQDFKYETGKINLGNVTFSFIEFSEIKYVIGNNFSIPAMKLFGVYNKILIRMTISFYENFDKLDLLNSIEINKKASH